MKHSTDLKQVSAILRKALEGDCTNVADYGAGTGTKGVELAEQLGKQLYRFDPALPEATNIQFFRDIYDADIVVCANVLNVIKDDAVLRETVKTIVKCVNASRGGVGWVSIYKAPHPSKTQRGEHPREYLDLFLQYNRQATLTGNVITLRKV